MPVIKTNRSHRIAYLVLLLVVAVALTTALVLAAERNSPQSTQAPKNSANNLVVNPGVPDAL